MIEYYEIFVDSIKAFVLGVIQGLTEFLPISSTAHLKVIPILIGWGDPGLSISASIQLGSLLAILIYFKQDIYSIYKGFIRIIITPGSPLNKDSSQAFSILLSSLPILSVGLCIKLFYPSYSDSPLRGLFAIGIISVIMSLFLYISDRNKKINRDSEVFSFRTSLIIGIAQILALLPGASRSGVTISTALMLGIDRESAAKYSFLLGVPAIFFSGISELIELSAVSFKVNLIPLFIGILSSTIFSILSIKFIMSYLQSNTYGIFVLYRLFFASLIFSYIIFL